MNRLTLLIMGLLWALPTAVSASNNFHPGYVILQNGERLEGFLEFKDRERNPRTAVFRSSLKGESKVYHPLDLQAFGVEKERFVSAIFATENTSIFINQLTTTKDFILGQDTAFLRTIVAGSVGLYQFKNDKGVDNFYIRDEKGYTLLFHKFYMEYKNDGTAIKVEENLYRSQLSDYLGTCGSIYGLIAESEYTLNYLENLFTTWYACTAKEMEFHREPDRLLFEFGALLGVSLTKLNLTSSAPHLNNSVFETSYNPTVGLYMDMILPRFQRRVSINSELMFSSYGTAADYTDTVYSTVYIKYHSAFAFAYLSLKNMLRYRWPIGSMTLFGNLGISNGIALRTVNTKVKSTTLFSTNRDETYPVIQGQRNHEQALLLGLGLKFNRFSVEGRYQRGNGFSKNVSVATRTHQFNLLAGFKF